MTVLEVLESFKKTKDKIKKEPVGFTILHSLDGDIMVSREDRIHSMDTAIKKIEFALGDNHESKQRTASSG